jgi:hypothetical protein
MAKELDTSWFDLKNYEAFKTMSIEEWIYQFIVRDHYHRLERNRLVGDEEHDRWLSWVVSTLKPGVIADSPNYPVNQHPKVSTHQHRKFSRLMCRVIVFQPTFFVV